MTCILYKRCSKSVNCLSQNADQSDEESDTTESSTANATNNEAINEDAADVTQTEEEELGKVKASSSQQCFLMVFFLLLLFSIFICIVPGQK